MIPMEIVAETFASNTPFNVEDLIAALGQFIPHPSSLDDEYRLIRILAGFDLLDNKLAALPAMFSLMERCPDADLGSPGPLVHSIESTGIDSYQTLLEQSVLRRPMYLNLWMAGRILNSRRDLALRQKWIAILTLCRANPSFPETKELVDPWIKID
jgi:hypothetical protein